MVTAYYNPKTKRIVRRYRKGYEKVNLVGRAYVRRRVLRRGYITEDDSMRRQGGYLKVGDPKHIAAGGRHTYAGEEKLGKTGGIRVVTPTTFARQFPERHRKEQRAKRIAAYEERKKFTQELALAKFERKEEPIIISSIREPVIERGLETPPSVMSMPETGFMAGMGAMWRGFIQSPVREAERTLMGASGRLVSVLFPFETEEFKEETAEGEKARLTLGKLEFRKEGEYGVISGGTGIVEKRTPYTEEEALQSFPIYAPKHLVKEETRIAMREAEIESKQIAEKLKPKYEEKMKTKSQTLFDIWQEKVNQEKVSVDVAQKKYEEELKKYQDKINVEYDKEIQEKLKPYLKSKEEDLRKYAEEVSERAGTYAALSYVPFTIASTFALGALSVAAPTVAYPIIAASYIQTIANAERIITYATTRPLEFAIRTAVGVGGFIAGATVMKGMIPKPAAKPSKSVSQTLSVDKAIKIGKTKDGIDLYQIKGQAITKIKDIKTGKVDYQYNEVMVNVGSKAGKKGAITSVFESWADGLKKSDIIKSKGKVQIKVTTSKGQGKVTFSPTEVEKIWQGAGEFKIQEVAVTKVKGIKADIRYKQGKIYEGVISTLMKEVAVGKRIDITKLIWGKGAKKVDYTKIVSGKQRVFVSESLVDLYGFKGIEAISKGKVRGVTKAFIPRDVAFKFNDLILGYGKSFKGESIIIKGIKPTKPTSAFQDVILGREQAIASGIGKSIVKAHAMKAIPKIKFVKPSPAVSTIPISITGIAAVQPKLTQAQIKKQDQAERLRLEQSQLMTQKEKQRQAEALSQVSRTVLRERESQALSQAQSQRLAQRQAQRLRQILVQPTPPIPIIHIPMTPPHIPPVVLIPPIIPPFTAPFLESIRRKVPSVVKKRVPRRRYQPSVGAVVLGIAAPIKEIKKISERITGWELRPMVKSLQLQQKELLHSAFYKSSPREKKRMIQKQKEFREIMRIYSKHNKKIIQKQSKLLVSRMIPLTTTQKRKHLRKRKKQKERYDVFGEYVGGGAKPFDIIDIIAGSTLKKSKKRKK